MVQYILSEEIRSLNNFDIWLSRKLLLHTRVYARRFRTSRIVSYINTLFLPSWTVILLLKMNNTLKVMVAWNSLKRSQFQATENKTKQNKTKQNKTKQNKKDYVSRVFLN